MENILLKLNGVNIGIGWKDFHDGEDLEAKRPVDKLLKNLRRLKS